MKGIPTKVEFLKRVENHTVKILKDDGGYRHIRLDNNGRTNAHFELVTWPGHLCITGDYGCYTFARVDDMFSFFRQDSLGINPRYWGEKLKSICWLGGYREFSEEKFIDRVMGYTENASDDLLEEIQDSVLVCSSNECDAYGAVNRFCSECGFEFQDFFDGGGTDEYTYHYIWCLYAIVWGISQYDQFKEQGE